MLLLLLAVGYQVIAVAWVTRQRMAQSRRGLALTLVLVLPVLGLPLAVLVRRVRGGELACGSDPGERPRPEPPVDLRELVDVPSALDRLLSDDAGERLAALVNLVASGDASAVALLRWTIAHGNTEAVLDAALALEELDLRTTQQLDATRRRFLAEGSFDSALAAGDAVVALITSGLADRAAIPELVARAAQYFAWARRVDPGRSGLVLARQAQLELATGHPRAALAIADRILDDDDDGTVELDDLCDAAAFAARHFGRVRANPEDAVPDVGARPAPAPA